MDDSWPIIFKLLSSFRYIDNSSAGPDVDGILQHILRKTPETPTFHTLTSQNQPAYLSPEFPNLPNRRPILTLLPLPHMQNPTPTPRTKQTLQNPPLQRGPLVDLQTPVSDYHVHHGPECPLEHITQEDRGDAESGGGLRAAFGAVADVDFDGGGGGGQEVDECALAGGLHLG